MQASTMSKLKVISYNFQSFCVNQDIILNLLNHCDVLLLQETLLGSNDKWKMGNLNSQFDFFGAPAVRNSNNFVGRSSGGLGILWRKSLGIITDASKHDDRIISVTLTSSSANYLLLNIYCICDYRNDEALVSYKSTMADLKCILDQKSFDEVVICGDWNCDPNKGRFFQQAMELCGKYDLCMSDVNLLPENSFTYLSNNNACSTSWLDHVSCSTGVEISKIRIMYEISFCDHIPLCFELELPDVQPKELQTIAETDDKEFFWIAWDKMSKEDNAEYADYLDFLVSDLSSESLNCNNNNCKSEHHTTDLNKVYNFLIDCMLEASIDYHHSLKGRPYKKVVGWNNHCKESYIAARNAFLKWKEGG